MRKLASGLAGINSLAFRKDGRLYAATVDGKTGATRDMLHGFKAPHDAVVLADGSILVAELGTKSLVRVSGEHGKDRTTLIGDLEGPVGLVGGSRGEVYVTEAFAGTVARVDGNGEKTVLARELKMPEGLARDGDGKLIVAEVGAKRLIEIVPETSKVTEIAANLPIGLAGAPGGLPTHIPTGVAVGATGVIYFSSDIENAIYKAVKK